MRHALSVVLGSLAGITMALFSVGFAVGMSVRSAIVDRR